MGAFGGTNVVGNHIEANSGAGGAFGLSKFVAMTAGYTHDSRRDSSIFFCVLYPGQTINPIGCYRNDSHYTIHEMMGGVRFSAVNRSRFTPYAGVSLGVVKQTSDDPPSRLTGFGFAPNAGVDVKLTRHFGVNTDAAYVKANRFTGFYRVTGGVVFRF